MNHIQKHDKTTWILFVTLLICSGSYVCAQQRTFCNPINIDYGYTPIPNFSEQGRHRATADPVITVFKGNYYLFSTNQWGYWVSADMVKWRFIARKFLKPWHQVYDELCAPAVWVMGDTLLVIGSTYAKNFPIWMSQDPTKDNWKEAIDSFEVGAWDPSFFTDEDGRLYIYFGSSNTYPIYGQEINRRTFKPIGERKALISLADSLHGWERFGEANDNTFLRPFMEGAWVNKHQGRYYLQYGAPGTEFSGYGDGVYISEAPLGPFRYQSHNPFAYKPGGFARGAGHGATYQDVEGRWWHVGTMVISVKNNFERRLGIWPAGFDKDGLLFCNTAYGDFPSYTEPRGPYPQNPYFTGWMLLNLNKPVQVSSTYGSYSANLAVDEDIKTYWSAVGSKSGEWIQSDLGELSTIHAVQVNYADQDADVLGKPQNSFHQYRLSASTDGKKWMIISDKSQSNRELPHDYVVLDNPVTARYVRMENLHMPTGKFAISGLRVFGRGHGKAPAPVKQFIALRGASERRNAWLKWQLADDASGYTIYAGHHPDKLYTAVTVYGRNEYYFRALERDMPAYFRVEAFNEHGISTSSETIMAE